MKKIISVLVLAALMSVAAFAQKHEKGGKNKEEWRDKVRAEQVAFLTSELNLSEAEAQKFWPVYNDIQTSRRAAYKESFDAMKALEEGLQKGDAGDLLDKYIGTKKKIQDLDNESVDKYLKVLSKEKVAKLVLSQERFRHKQIGKLGGGPQGGRPGGPQGGPGRFNGRPMEDFDD